MKLVLTNKWSDILTNPNELTEFKAALLQFPWRAELAYNELSAAEVCENIDAYVRILVEKREPDDPENLQANSIITKRDDILEEYAKRSIAKQDFEAAGTLVSAIYEGSLWRKMFQKCLAQTSTLDDLGALASPARDSASALFRDIEGQIELTVARISQDYDALQAKALEITEGVDISEEDGKLKLKYLCDIYDALAKDEHSRGQAVQLAKGVVGKARSQKWSYDDYAYFSEALVGSGDSMEPFSAYRDIQETSPDRTARIKHLARLAYLLQK